MSSPFCYPLYSYYLAGSFAVRSGDHLLFWDHLRSNLGIICGPIWGSFAVQFGDHLWSNLGIICGPIWGSFVVLFGEHLRSGIICGLGIICGAVQVSLKSLSKKVIFSKTIVRQCWSFKLEEKHLQSINGKKKFKRILVEGEKFKFRKLPSEDFIACFLHGGELALFWHTTQ